MKTATAATLLASATLCLSASADVIFHDNSDLTFKLSPFESRAAFAPGLFEPLLVQTMLHPFSTPAENADGFGSGLHTFRSVISRTPPSGSSTESDYIAGVPSDSVRIGYTGNWMPFSAELTTLSPGDLVDESAFVPFAPFPNPYYGVVSYFALGDGLTPLYGDEAYIAFSFDEPDGTRYGFLRITYMENVELDLVDEFNVPTGETTLRNLYMVTGWGYESELNTPALVTDGTTPDCLADVNGDGLATPADFTAWINAFNNNLPACDQNGDNDCTPTDFTAWLNNFNTGC
ncbi:MAG: hypothetical protein Phyf2KO_14950 [Phycisphaerales bacterium]